MIAEIQILHVKRSQPQVLIPFNALYLQCLLTLGVIIADNRLSL